MIVKSNILKSKQTRNPGEIPIDGKEYLVLGIIIYNNNKPEIHILDDKEEGPALYDFELFDIIDDSIPRDWIVHENIVGYYFEPQRFKKENFWSDFHDGKREAELIFQEEYNKIAAFHGWEQKEFEFPGSSAWKPKP